MMTCETSDNKVIKEDGFVAERGLVGYDIFKYTFSMSFIIAIDSNDVDSLAGLFFRTVVEINSPLVTTLLRVRREN